MGDKPHPPGYVLNVVPLLDGLLVMAMSPIHPGWIGEVAGHVHTLAGHAHNTSGAPTCTEILHRFSLGPQGTEGVMGRHTEGLAKEEAVYWQERLPHSAFFLPELSGGCS